MMITMPATLDTARVHLRAPVITDADELFVCLGDAEATRYMVWPRAEDIGDARYFLDDITAGWAAGDDYSYALVERTGGAVIGLAGCQFSDEGAELGFILRPDRWGEGLAHEAIAAVLAAAWDMLDLYRVWAVCDVDNAAAARVLEKLGMTHEGRLRRRSARPNLDTADGPRDDDLYALVR